MRRHLLGTLLLSASLATPALAGEGWIDDYDEAVEIARKEGKHLLVDFTGSDWCGWCIRLDKEVFQHDAFLDGVRDDWVLVSLDFPRSKKAKAEVPNPKRNKELSQHYGVSGFPTILLLTEEGEVIAKTGYQAGGPEKYVAHIVDITREPLAKLASVRELVAAFEGASGEDRPALLEKALQHVERNGKEGFGGLFVPGLRIALDTEDVGLRSRVIRALARVGDVDDSLLDAASAADPKNARGLRGDTLLAFVEAVNREEDIAPAVKRIDAFLGGEGMENLDGDSAILLHVYGAHWYKNFLDDADKARRYAQLGLERSDPGHRARNALRKLAEG